MDAFLFPIFILLIGISFNLYDIVKILKEIRDKK